MCPTIFIAVIVSIPALRHAATHAVRGFFYGFPLYRKTLGVSSRLRNEAPRSELRGILRNSPSLLRRSSFGYGGFSSPCLLRRSSRFGCEGRASPQSSIRSCFPSVVALSGLLRRAKKGGGVGQATGYSARRITLWTHLNVTGLHVWNNRSTRCRMLKKAVLFVRRSSLVSRRSSVRWD